MASIEQVNAALQENQDTLNWLKKQQPGTYQITYNYVSDNNYIYNYDFNVKIGNVDSSGAINYNGPGRGNKITYIEGYLDNNIHNSIDISYAGNIVDTGRNDEWCNSVSNLIDDISNTFEIEKNVTYNGHSYSADFVNHMAAFHAGKHNTDKLYIVCTEPDANYELSSKERNALIESDATVIFAFSQSYLQNKKNQFNDSYNGIHMVNIKVNTNGQLEGEMSKHNLPNMLLAQAGITNIANGEFDFTKLPTEYTINYGNGQTKEVSNLTYTITEYYVDENGNWVTRTFNVNKDNMDILNDLNETVCPSKSNVKGETIQSHNDIKQKLESINDLTSNVLSSDYNFVLTYMNAIRGIIKKSSVHNMKMATFSGLNDLLNTIQGAVINFHNSVEDSLVLLEDSTRKIVSASEKIVEMDKELSDKAFIDFSQQPIIDSQITPQHQAIVPPLSVVTPQTTIIDLKPEEKSQDSIIKPQPEEKSQDSIIKPQSEEKSQDPITKPQPEEKSQDPIIKPQPEEKSQDPIIKPQLEEKPQDPIIKPQPESSKTKPAIKPRTKQTNKSSNNKNNDNNITSKDITSNELSSIDYQNNKPEIIDIPETDENTINPEVVIPKPTINEQPIINPVNEGDTNKNVDYSTLKTIGIVGGIGLAAGTAAYIANEHLKSKTPEDYDYNYENNNDDNGFVEYEDLNDESYNAFQNSEVTNDNI